MRVQGTDPVWIVEGGPVRERAIAAVVLALLCLCGCCRKPAVMDTTGQSGPTAAVDEFVLLLRELRTRETMDDEAFDKILASGRRAFAPGLRLAPEHLETLVSYSTRSIGEGDREIEECRLVSVPRSERDRLRNRFEMFLQCDRSGNVVDFYWDRPIPPGAEVVDAEQLGIFLRYVADKDFSRMARKGEQLFRKGRKVPDHAGLFAQYPREVSSDYVRYTFFSEVGPGGAAEANIFFEPGSDRVRNFRAVSASF